MHYQLRLNHQEISAFKKNRPLFLIWGIALVILGSLALSYSVFTTFVSVLLLGVFIFSSGVVILLDTSTFWWKKWKGFFLFLFMGLLYVFVGSRLIRDPLLATFSLTFLLGLFYVFLGTLKMFYSLYVHAPQWQWSLFNGIASLALGFLILFYWPESSHYIIGIVVGVDLLLSGLAYIMYASSRL